MIFVNVLEVHESGRHMGGVERHIHDICMALMEKGHKPVILTLKHQKPSFEIVNGVPVYRTHIPYKFRITRYPMILLLSLHIARLVRRCNIDVIHAHDYPPGVASVFASLLLHKPVVVTFHLPIWSATYSAHFTILPLFEKAIREVFVSHVVAIICVSNFTYAETKKLGFPIHKLKVIYNWVTPLLKCEMSEQNGTLKNLRLNKRRFVLSVGRLVDSHKGFSMLIHALKLLIDKGYTLDLVIVGEGPDKEALAKYSTKLGIKNHVHLLDNISDSDLAFLYSTCNMFVLPSRFEGLPLTLLEAINFGKPIVATTVGGIPEIIEDGYNGILVDPNSDMIASGIEKLLSSPNLANILAERSKNVTLKRFSKHNCTMTRCLLEAFSSNLEI